jgi:hypothetical protein
MHMKKVLIALFFTVVFLFGCSTPEKVAKLQGQGPAHIYPASYEKTWKAAVDSAWDLGLTVQRVYPEQGFISAKRGMTAKTFGEDVGIWLKEAGAGKTQVEVISRQKGIPMLEVKNWEDNLFQSIGERVGGLPFAQGTAPGSAATLQASGSKFPPPADVLVTKAPPTPAPPPVQHPGVKTPAAEQARLREHLKGYLAGRQEEFKKETDPARRKFLEYEMDYLREELSNVESKIARGAP